MRLKSNLIWVLILVAVICPSSWARPSRRAETCGYDSCPQGKEGLINVHLLAHTHDDVGWLKTVDQYYYGARNDIQDAGVQYIIDSVIEELKDHPDRRFIYVEMAFFTQWWNEQTEEMKDVVRGLVAEGRFEFINGGWCMNDEAATHYVDIIDQMSLGLNILNETFGECGRPRIAWQLDPFGHSREQALLFAQMGYDAMFFGRLDHEDIDQRKKSKTMEMVWSASNNNLLGAGGELFTGINFNIYWAPDGFCFDMVCDAEPIIDNPKSRDYNVDKRVDEFLAYCERHAAAYATDNILVYMGSDFTYQDANIWYTNMDKLIKYANARQVNGSRYNLFYSTPSCYTKALNDANRSWPVKTDDFFPYGSEPNSYWTGYFTSRPASKYMIRQGSNLLQSCKQMESFLSLKGATSQGDVKVMKEAMGIMQHHDAATGTEKQHVANDYARLLHIGVEECQKTQTSYYEKELPIGDAVLPPVFYCQLNMSECGLTEQNDRFVVTVYNSLARNIDKYIRIPVLSRVLAYEILDPQGNQIPSQSVQIADLVQTLPGRESTAGRELVFLASGLPPLGSKSYYVQPAPAKSNVQTKESTIKTFKRNGKGPRVDETITNGKVSVSVDGNTGLITSVTVDGVVTPLEQEFMWYAGAMASPGLRASGAYIFRPNGTEPFPLPTTGVSTTLIQGELVQEIHQKYNDWVGQVIRLYKGQDHVELDWVVGSIPVEDGVAKEIVSRFTTNIASNGEFYTDSNGRQTMKRKIDTRESFNYTVTEPVSANYYPVNSHIYLKNPTGKQMTLLVDRSQGGASLKDGHLELMVHRRLLHDDGYGVDEALNETAYGRGLVVRGTHYLILTSGSSDGVRLARSLGQELYKQPQVSFMATTLSFTDWTAKYRTEQQSLSRTLPDNVNLLSFERRADGKFLLRLEHVYDVGEDPVLSQPQTVSIDGLFPGFTVSSMNETTLGGNQWIEDSNRLVWNKAGQKMVGDEEMDNRSDHEPAAASAVSLQPMQIRTYIVTLTAN